MEFSFNIGYLTQIIQNVAIPLIILGLGIVLFFLIAYINHDKNYTNVVKHFSDKFPLVSPEFIKKTQMEQTIENNEEIHKLNKNYEEIKDTQNKILYIINNTNILQSMTLDEVKKNNG